MPIVVNVDVMMAKRKVGAGTLAERIELTGANLSILKNNKAKGFYYWEPAWIPVKGSEWANEASLKYINDPGPGGNEWANQALFDYDGNALPALKVIKNF